jgi:ketosteroid isomerase-like protein
VNDTHQNIELPEVIRSYQNAHDRGDVDAALSAFTADARVHDEEREYRGTETIRDWVTDTSAKFTYTRTMTGAERLEDGTWLVQNHLEGDFPGGVVDLRYRFILTGGRIADLTITP